jgi:hypothetical protein
MRFATGLALVGFLAATPVLGQIVTPDRTPPPCSSANRCLKPPRPVSPIRLACPSGTVYIPQKGVCRVLPVTGHG